jgi:uncharacterized membrane protein YtjA (UPF0391 family)
MRKVYMVLAYVVAAEVVVQAMLMVWAIAGLTKWVNNGGVFDKALMEDRQTISYPELVGVPLHGLNGGIIIPAIALVLFICSFFAKVSGGVKWAAIVLVLAIVQGQLGYLGHDFPAAGALHGLNALALFTVALHTARRSRAGASEAVAAADVPARTVG